MSKNKQTTDTVLLVRPAAFTCNEETAASNAFQTRENETDAQEKALAEFDAYAALLRANGINAVIVEDTQEPRTPDAVFPNNWFSTHEDGTLVIYPMYAQNRRLERKQTALEAIRKTFRPERVVDMTAYEQRGLFLEGTGSMVLDRVNRVAYACRSVRTSETVLRDFCKQLGYKPVVFDAADQNGKAVYHTNVMLHVGSRLAVVCLKSVADECQRNVLRESLAQTEKTLVEITPAQMNRFAGNMLEMQNNSGEPCLLLSRTAYDALTDEQRRLLQRECRLIVPDIPCIERNGGGSARCMAAEIFPHDDPAPRQRV